MRTSVAVALVTVCLGLTGCSLFGKKQAAHTNRNPKPFLGSEAPTKKEIAAISAPSSGPLPGANGFLAGHVVALSTGDPVNASIEIRDLENLDSKAARLSVDTDGHGYFTIEKLKPGGHYQLIARSKEGGELISDMKIVRAPNISLYFRLSKHNTRPETPPIPDPPKTPDKKGTTGTESSQTRLPDASLGAPFKIPPPGPGAREGDSTPANVNNGANPGNDGSANISNIVEGFRRIPPPPTVEVPGPQPRRSGPWPAPPPAQWESVPDNNSPSSKPPESNLKPAGSVRIPEVPTRVPSCGLYGDRLDNFALRDLRGNPWEFKRDFHGKLLLLDFWHTSCGHCLTNMPRLVELQRVYKNYGLEIVGIDCEPGPVVDQRKRVGGVCARYRINYTMLLSNGYLGSCPVVKSFQVDKYPTLVLFDDNGKRIWKSEGLDDDGYRVLKKIIENRLLANR